MDFLIRFLKGYWTYIVIAILLLLLACSTGYIFLYENSKVKESVNESEISYVTDVEKTLPRKIKVDVKGAVKKPGVYELESDQRINNAIKAAGGFKSKAYSDNINLSKKLVDEMVIYVYTKTEYKNLNKKEVEQTSCLTNTYTIDNCITEGNSVIESSSNSNVAADSENVEENVVNSIEPANKKVSINNGSKEELMTLNGIGEAKAESIIKYREENGSFKSLEDLKNVSGIGDAAYEKIKDNITL